MISQEPRLALGVEKVNHGSHKFRVVSPHVVEMDLLVQVKSFLVQMTLELFLHRRAKRLYTYIYMVARLYKVGDFVAACMLEQVHACICAF